MHKKYMVIDFEATCFEDKDKPEDFFQEIIEVGLCIVNPVGLYIEDELQCFVKPALSTKLSDFCKNLTSITQQDVDRGIPFEHACTLMETFYHAYSHPIFTSFGFYDYNQLDKQCKKFNVNFPFEKGIHCNIKQEFWKFMGYKKNPRGASFKHALNKYGLKFEGTPHRGIDDAKMISRVLIGMIKDGYSYEQKV